MKSRHLIALATGTCLGLAGLGQTAFADRGGRDSESHRSCSADHEDDSENSLLGLIGLQNVLVGSLNNLLCGSNVLNNLNLTVLGETDDDGGDSESEVECDANHENESENEQQSLIGLQNIGVGSLNNLLCGSNVGNDIDINVAGESDDDGGDSESEVECNADHENESDNDLGGGLLSVLGIQNLLVGSGNNLGCGANILNGLSLNILGRS